MSKTYGSFFSGGGVADVGAKAAGYDLVFAVEYDAKIAAVYALNLGDHIIVADVRNLDIASLPWVNHFHASPVCTRASVANKNRGEAQIDIDTATATAAYIRHHLPDTVTIENVTQYRDFESYRIIIRALDECGYWHNSDNLNSANFGVPQTRRRLIVRAVRGGFVPPLPASTRWIGWYEAVEDIIDTFEPSEFAPWQLDRLPEDMQIFMTRQIKYVPEERGDGYFGKDLPAPTLITTGATRAFIVPGDNKSTARVHSEIEPSMTVGNVNRVGNIPRAFILDGDSANYGESMAIKDRDEPMTTIRASANHKPARAWLSQGRVVKISPRGLARFQSIPDWYQLPDNKALACKIIGNGWPSKMAEIILKTLYDL